MNKFKEGDSVEITNEDFFDDGILVSIDGDDCIVFEDDGFFTECSVSQLNNLNKGK